MALRPFDNLKKRLEGKTTLNSKSLKFVIIKFYKKIKTKKSPILKLIQNIKKALFFNPSQMSPKKSKIKFKDENKNYKNR